MLSCVVVKLINPKINTELFKIDGNMICKLSPVPLEM